MSKAVKFVSGSPRFHKVIHQFVERDKKTNKPIAYHPLVFQFDPDIKLGVLVLDSKYNDHVIKLIEEEIDKEVGEGKTASDFAKNVRKFDKKKDIPIKIQNEMKAEALDKAAENLKKMGLVLDPETGDIKEIKTTL